MLVVCGDQNGDHSIDIVDAIIGAQIVVGKIEPTATIKFHDGQRKTLWTNNAIAAYIVDTGTAS